MAKRIRPTHWYPPPPANPDPLCGAGGRPYNLATCSEWDWESAAKRCEECSKRKSAPVDSISLY